MEGSDTGSIREGRDERESKRLCLCLWRGQEVQKGIQDQ